MLCVHRARVERGRLVRCQRASETVFPTSDLHWLVLNVVVWLSSDLLVFHIAGDDASLVKVLLGVLEIFESVATWPTDILRVLGHEVVLVLLVDWRVALAGHNVAARSTLLISLSLIDTDVLSAGLVRNLGNSHGRGQFRWLDSRVLLLVGTSHANVEVEMLQGGSHVNRLVDTPLIWYSSACRWNSFTSIFSRRVLGELTVTWRFISSWIWSLFAFSDLLELGNYLHWVRVLSWGRLDLAVRTDGPTVSQFRVKQIALSRPHLRVLPLLHLNLLLNLGWNLPRWSVDLTLSSSSRPISYIVVLPLRHIHWSAIMRASRLWEQVVLIGWSLQVLVLGCLAIYCPWYLNLNVGSVAYLLLNNSLLLTSGAVKVLSRLVHQSVRWCASHCEVHVLCWTSACWSSSSLGCVLPVSFDTLNELSSFGVDFGKWVNCVVEMAILITHGPVVGNTSLNESPVTITSLCCGRHVVKVRVTATSIVSLPRVLKDGWWLVESSVHRRIHSLVVYWSRHLRRNVICTVIVGLMLATIGSGWHSVNSLPTFLRKHGALIDLLGIYFTVDWGR